MSKEQENNNEELNKSIDALIDELFVEEEVEKSIDIAGDSNTQADAVANQAPAFQDDASRGAGRPKQISDVPKNDEDGARAKEYDAAISEEGKEQDQDEIDQISDMSQVEEKGRMSGKAKAEAPKMAPFKKSLTEEEFNEYLELKKAKELKEQEDFKKAQVQEKEDLIKSVVERTSEKFVGKIEELTKSLNEQKELVKSMAKRPRQSKSITNVEAVEKSFNGEGQPKEEFFSKSEMLDAGMELALNKSIPEFRDDHLVELENNGFIYDPQARTILEKYLANKK